MNPKLTFPAHVEIELERVREDNDPIHSAHEGFAILLEEVDELWDEVRLPRTQRSKKRMRAELVQIATVAQRMAEDICDK